MESGGIATHPAEGPWGGKGALPAQGLSVGVGVAGLLQLAVLARGCGMWRQSVPVPGTHAASCSLGIRPCCCAGQRRGCSSGTSLFGALWPREAGHRDAALRGPALAALGLMASHEPAAWQAGLVAIGTFSSPGQVTPAGGWVWPGSVPTGAR